MNHSHRSSHAKQTTLMAAIGGTALMLMLVVAIVAGNPAFAQKGGNPDDAQQQPAQGGGGCATGSGCGPKGGCAGGGCAKNDPAKEGLSEIREQYLKSSSGRGANDSVEPDWNRFGMNGSDCRTCKGEAVPGHINGGRLNAQAYAQVPTFIPKEFVQFDTRTKRLENEVYNNFVQTTGYPLTDTAYQVIGMKMMDTFLAKASDPERMVPVAQAWGQSQAIGTANAAADMARNQATSAIEYCSSYLHNFTVEPNNKWNKLRDELFVPIAVLLLLPGAVLSQVRATMSQGSPVIAQMNPFDGILRSIIAVFAIPATYLVINYGIDLSNSITYTIHSEYKRLFKSDMYEDALAAEVRATPVRKPEENRNAVDLPTVNMTPLLNGKTAFGKFEGMNLANKYEDPSAGVYIVPEDRPDEALSSGVVASRMAMMGANAGLAMTWNLLCAFQLAYFYYLWFAGPIAAALWVWPMKPLQNALPSWIEGVVTLSFWSLFWNTVVLLMACFKGVDDTGTLMTTALNFLATACVKYAFDFAGLVKAAGQEAASKAMNGSGKGSQGASGGGGGGATNHNTTGASTASSGSSSSTNTSLLPASNSGSVSGALLTSAGGGSSGAGSAASTMPPLRVADGTQPAPAVSLAATGLLSTLAARLGDSGNGNPAGVALPPLSHTSSAGGNRVPSKATALGALKDDGSAGSDAINDEMTEAASTARGTHETNLHQTGVHTGGNGAAFDALMGKANVAGESTDKESEEKGKAARDGNRRLQENELNKRIQEMLTGRESTAAGATVSEPVGAHNASTGSEAMQETTSSNSQEQAATQSAVSVTGTILDAANPATMNPDVHPPLHEKPVADTSSQPVTSHAAAGAPPTESAIDFMDRLRDVVGGVVPKNAIVEHVAVASAGAVGTSAANHYREAVAANSLSTTTHAHGSTGSRVSSAASSLAGASGGSSAVGSASSEGLSQSAAASAASGTTASAPQSFKVAHETNEAQDISDNRNVASNPDLNSKAVPNVVANAVSNVLASQAAPNVLASQAAPNVLASQAAPSVLASQAAPSVLASQAAPSVLASQAAPKLASNPSRHGQVVEQERSESPEHQSRTLYHAPVVAFAKAVPNVESISHAQPARVQPITSHSQAAQNQASFANIQTSQNCPGTPQDKAAQAQPPLANIPAAAAHSAVYAQTAAPLQSSVEAVASPIQTGLNVKPGQQSAHAQQAAQPMPQSAYAQQAAQPIPQSAYAQQAAQPMPQSAYAQQAAQPMPQSAYAQPAPQKQVVSQAQLRRADSTAVHISAFQVPPTQQLHAQAASSAPGPLEMNSGITQSEAMPAQDVQSQHSDHYAAAALPGTVEYLSAAPQSTNVTQTTNVSQNSQSAANNVVMQKQEHAPQAYPVPLLLTNFPQPKNGPMQVSPPPVSPGRNGSTSSSVLQSANQSGRSAEDPSHARKVYDFIDFGSESDAESDFNPPEGSGVLSPTHPLGVSPPPASTFRTVLNGVDNARKI